MSDDKDHFKVVADARLKLDMDTALALLCTAREDSRGKSQAVVTSVDASKGAVRFRKYRSMRKSEATTDEPHRRKG